MSSMYQALLCRLPAAPIGHDAQCSMSSGSRRRSGDIEPLSKRSHPEVIGCEEGSFHAIKASEFRHRARRQFITFYMVERPILG
jgi:hypothetical protein